VYMYLMYYEFTTVLFKILCQGFLLKIFVGHEFAFVAFLFCLFKIGACDENDLTAVGCRVFPRYVSFTYCIQLIAPSAVLVTVTEYH